jgi:glycerol-3-phosphate acyltransferase PlsY
MDAILPFLLPLLGYLFGSLPFAVWVTRLVRGVDVRDAGSGHASTTNTIRQAGFGWGALVLVLDIAKGFVPVWLALTTVKQDVLLPYIVPLTAALAVAGHCWPVFAQFRGGMGLATAGGALLAIHPLAFLLSLGILILLTLTIRHSARASVFTGLLIAPLLWLFNLRGIAIWAAVAIGLVIAFRFLIDWNRKYRELWLDREKSKDA